MSEYTAENLDRITKKHTAFGSFQELLDAKGGYFPSMNVKRPAMRLLADAYDMAQADRGDGRRAYRFRV